MALRRLASWTVLSVGGLALCAVALRLRGLPALVAGLALLTAALLLATRVTERQWQAWGYCEREEDLLVRHGLVVRRLSVVPFGRMQFVDVTAGPLDRRFGLATVHLHTAAAASDARIPGLATAEATRLRDRLALLGEARAAGL